MHTPPPSWGCPAEPWTLDRSRADGTYIATNANSCDMILEQAYMPPLGGDDDLSSDAAATQSHMAYLLDFLADLEGGTADGEAGTVPPSVPFPGGPTPDFATTTLLGTTTGGEDGTRMVATRAMPAGTGVGSTIITCPRTLVDAEPGYFLQTPAEMYVLPAP